jgi:CheY-like chemotaxis protein
MICKQFLNKLGCQIDIAETGYEAIEKFNENNYQLILMDCNMPEMDGFQATDKIRTIEQTKGLSATTIVALTAHVQEEVKRRCLEAGMNGFLSKPFVFDDLERFIIEANANYKV